MSSYNLINLNIICYTLKNESLENKSKSKFEISIIFCLYVERVTLPYTVWVL